MNQNYFNYNSPPNRNSSSTRPVVFGFLAIVVLVSIFVIKNYQSNKKNLAATEEQQQTDNTISAPLIQPEEVSKLINKKEYLLIDIREKTLFEQKHIESSINVPFSTINENAKAFDKTKMMIIIDQGDTQEGQLLTEHLNEQGARAKYMDGGIAQYYLMSLPIVSFGDPESLQDQSKATPLTATELNQRTQAGESFKFIDVRSKTDFDQSHIEGAINIPLEEIEQRKNEVPAGKIITCDDNSMRSFQAAVKLYDLNFWGVYYLSDSLSTLKEVVNNSANNPAGTSSTAAPATTPTNTSINPTSNTNIPTSTNNNAATNATK